MRELRYKKIHFKYTSKSISNGKIIIFNWRKNYFENIDIFLYKYNLKKYSILYNNNI